MENPKINPERITTPIQLLAVWFAGLILLEGILLSAAKVIDKPLWLVPFLVISGVTIIPIFIIVVFLLQTRYRAQMLKDNHYAKYLDKTTNQVVTFDSTLIIEKLQYLESELIALEKNSPKNISFEKKFLDNNEKTFIDDRIEILVNKVLPDYKNIIIKFDEIGYNSKPFIPHGSKTKLETNEISVGKNVNPEQLKIIIESLPDKMFSRVSMVPGIEDRGFTIIVGSYLHRDSKYKFVNLDDDFIFDLGRLQNNEDLRNLMNF